MTESEAQLQAAEALLKEAQLSYVRHEEGRKEPFNIFSALHVERKEIRHSWFLATLLNYRKSGSMSNLEDFLEIVIGKDFKKATGHDFQCKGIKIERERYNIDILIVNNEKQAIIIENKIDAADRREQLEDYHNTVKSHGYNDILCVYLTLHDRNTKTSRGNLRKEDVIKVLYEDSNFIKWLERCRQRACDEPELRESTAQYLHLVRKLTGTDQRREYMNELKELLLKEDNNLVLADHLSEAVREAKIHLVRELWKEIECALSKIEGFPCKSREQPYLEYIRYYVLGGVAKFGLYYPFGDDHAILFVEVHSHQDHAFAGLRFNKEKSKEWLAHYVESRKLKELEGWFGNSEWAWYRYVKEARGLRNLTARHLKVLSNEAERTRIAGNVAQLLEEAWKRLKPA